MNSAELRGRRLRFPGASQFSIAGLFNHSASAGGQKSACCGGIIAERKFSDGVGVAAALGSVSGAPLGPWSGPRDPSGYALRIFELKFLLQG